jgi:hypothetical protein
MSALAPTATQREPSAYHFLAALLAGSPAVDVTAVEDRGRGVIATFEFGGLPYRVQIDPMTRKEQRS